MTDLLTPDEVRKLDRNVEMVTFIGYVREDLHRLCRDYLTLWERNKWLKADHDSFLQKVARDLSDMAEEVREL